MKSALGWCGVPEIPYKNTTAIFLPHQGGVRFTNQGLQARAAKSSLARPFMARSYYSSYFWDTTLAII